MMPFAAKSPYACRYSTVIQWAKTFETAYGLRGWNGVLSVCGDSDTCPNISLKVTRGIASILLGQAEKLYLGNLDAQRDWGYPPEYVEAMWMMLQHDHPDDFIIATGEMHSVRELCETAFSAVGLDWERYVEIDERYLRPTDVDELRGDATKAPDVLGWRPQTKFDELVHIMLAADLVDAGLDAASLMSASLAKQD